MPPSSSSLRTLDARRRSKRLRRVRRRGRTRRAADTHGGAAASNLSRDVQVRVAWSIPALLCPSLRRRRRRLDSSAAERPIALRCQAAPRDQRPAAFEAADAFSYTILFSFIPVSLLGALFSDRLASYLDECKTTPVDN